MKVITCREACGFDCNAVMKGRTVEEAVDATIKHRVSMHGQNAKELQAPGARQEMGMIAKEYLP